jgi:copper homeostasis protein
MTPTHKTLVEICVDSLASAIAAERGGADRIELCIDLDEGGITPNSQLIRDVRAAVKIKLQVLIRPRAGNFTYSNEELSTMAAQIAQAKSLGADGVAIGVLHRDGSVDIAATTNLVETAKPLDVTFHRAFELACAASGDSQALEDVIATGCNRILTSGVARAKFEGSVSALNGAASLRALIATAHNRIAILAGGGIREHNVREIVKRTGAREVHSSLNPSAAAESTIADAPSVAVSHASSSHHVATQVADPPSVVQAFQVRSFISAARL